MFQLILESSSKEEGIKFYPLLYLQRLHFQLFIVSRSQGVKKRITQTPSLEQYPQYLHFQLFIVSLSQGVKKTHYADTKFRTVSTVSV